jgi:hypothetical protein
MSDDSLNNLTEKQISAKLVEAEEILANSEKAIHRYKMLVALQKTDEYKEVFDSGYFDEYAQELFSELTNPPQFARIPLKDCEDLLAGIKALKSYVGFNGYRGKLETEAAIAQARKEQAQSVINAIG